jgi:hypothetical protein
MPLKRIRPNQLIFVTGSDLKPFIGAGHPALEGPGIDLEKTRFYSHALEEVFDPIKKRKRADEKVW